MTVFETVEKIAVLKEIQDGLTSNSLYAKLSDDERYLMEQSSAIIDEYIGELYRKKIEV